LFVVILEKKSAKKKGTLKRTLSTLTDAVLVGRLPF